MRSTSVSTRDFVPAVSKTWTVTSSDPKLCVITKEVKVLGFARSSAYLRAIAW